MTVGLVNDPLPSVEEEEEVFIHTETTTAMSDDLNPGGRKPKVEEAGAVSGIMVNESEVSVVLDKSHIQRDSSHYFAMFCWIGWTFFYFLLFFLSPFFYSYLPIFFNTLFVFIFLSAILPNELNKQPQWAIDFGDWLMVKAGEYFHLKMILEDRQAIETSGPALFAMEPHHILPLSIISFHRHNIGFKGHNMLGCITGICFSVPLMRHVYKWVHADSVDRKNLKKMLNNSISPVLCPGGVQEVFYLKTTPRASSSSSSSPSSSSPLSSNKEEKKECVLYLKKRLGFVKLAIEYGVPIIPVFTFGLHHSFDFWLIENKYLQWIGRKLGFLPMMFFGVWNLPLGPAKPSDYVNVVGKPIPTKKNDHPSEEEIKKILAIYIEEIERLYHTYKHQYGMGDVELRIV